MSLKMAALPPWCFENLTSFCFCEKHMKFRLTLKLIYPQIESHSISFPETNCSGLLFIQFCARRVDRLSTQELCAVYWF